MDFLKKGMFGGGRKGDSELAQMRIIRQLSQEENSLNEMERDVAIDFNQYEDLKFEDDLDSDKE